MKSLRSLNDEVGADVPGKMDDKQVHEIHERFGGDQKFLRLLLDSLEDYAVFTTDTNGLVITWNSGAEKVLGYKENEIMGSDSRAFYTAQDIKDKVPEKEFKLALQKGRSINERFHVRKDGSLFWGSGLAFPLLDENNQHLGYTKVMRDLTDRQKAQQALEDSKEYFKNIVDTVHEPLVVLNNDHTIHTANRAFLKMFKLDKQQALGTLIFEMDSAQWNVVQLKEILQQTISGKTQLTDIETEYNSPSTGKRVLRVNARKLYGVGNREEMILLALEDITDRKALEQQRNDFIGIVSHELKTPVTSLKAFGQVLQIKLAKLNDEQPVQMLQKMDAQINKLTHLINDLLDATKIEGGKLQLKEEIFFMDEVLNDTIEELQRTTTKHTIVKQGDAMVEIVGDKYRTGQVITNLLTNAIKYSPEADKIIVSTSLDGKMLTCHVQDFGIGIDPGKQEKVFERFYRVSEDELQTFPGMGLGLFISSEIIIRQGGKMWVKSELGKGSTFCFDVPINTNNKL